MKYFFILCTWSISIIASEPKQTSRDLLQHFINEANYGEIFRLCGYYMQDLQDSFINEALASLRKRDKSLIPLVKSAWQKYGTHLVEQSKKQFQPQSECMSEAEYKAYINKETLRTFTSWIESQ